MVRPLYRGFHLKQAAGEVSRLVLPTGAFENTVFSSSDREVYEEVPARFQDGFAEVTLRGECWFFCDSCRQKAVTPETEPVSAGKGLGRFYKSFLACYKVPKPVELPFVGSSAGEGKWMLLSARFDTPERMPYLRKIKQALEEKGVPTCLVDLMGGETFGMETMKALYHARAMAAFCSENYGALTGARYETFHELRYAWEHQITIMPVKLCNDYPPRPPDEAGRIQNAFVLSKSLIYIDGMGLSEEEVANELEKAWRR